MMAFALRSLRPARTALLGALLAGLAGAACAPRARAPRGPAAALAERPTVVLLSFDGFARRYLDGRVPLPNLRRLAARGVSSAGLVPSFPSHTFPNHFTLVTGKLPGTHGLVLNRMWDPATGASYSSKDSVTSLDPRWYLAEPIWVTAERAGVRTASYFWPASPVRFGGVQSSTYMAPYSDRLPLEARIDSTAAWLRRPDATRPHLITLYVPLLDQVAHKASSASVRVDSALRVVDHFVGALLDSLDASPVRANLIVLSDHGMLDVPPDHVIELRSFADLTGVRIMDQGPTQALFFGGDTARMERVYQAMRDGLAARGGHAHVYRRAELPARWKLRDDPRIGDLLVVADPTWNLTPRLGEYPMDPGQHGWDPEGPGGRGLDGILFATGPQIRARGTLPRVPNTDVYLLLARLLGLTPAPGVDGTPALADRLLGR